MVMPKDMIQSEMLEAWRTFLNSMEKSLEILEKEIEEASQMAGVCTNEWCAATEHVIDDLSQNLFSISEPRWSDPEDSRRIRDLRRKLHDLYANYREVYKSIAG